VVSYDSYDVRYDHFIAGEVVLPVNGRVSESPTPVTGQPFAEGAGVGPYLVNHSPSNLGYS
jgi:hypothetical protein